jgi:hypothetical protein
MALAPEASCDIDVIFIFTRASDNVHLGVGRGAKASAPVKQRPQEFRDTAPERRAVRLSALDKAMPSAADD